MFDPREYAKGMLNDLQDGVDGLEGFLLSVDATSLLSSDEDDLMLKILARARGFCKGFRCCLEQWPVPMKEAAND